MHTATVQWSSSSQLLTVIVDSVVVLRVPLSRSRVAQFSYPDGTAHVGFTSETTAEAHAVSVHSWSVFGAGAYKNPCVYLSHASHYLPSRVQG